MAAAKSGRVLLVSTFTRHVLTEGSFQRNFSYLSKIGGHFNKSEARWNPEKRNNISSTVEVLCHMHNGCGHDGLSCTKRYRSGSGPHASHLQSSRISKHICTSIQGLGDTHVFDHNKRHDGRENPNHKMTGEATKRTVPELTSDFGMISFKTNLCSTEELEEFQDIILKDLIIKENFLSNQEESDLVEELQRPLRKSKYNFDHWDGAIEGYREIEKGHWNDRNMKTLEKIQKFCFGVEAQMLPAVHVLDLSEDGYIRPHIDSSRYCGPRIAGVSLLSPSIMRFKKPEQDSVMADVLLRPRSLYVMSGDVRYGMTHEILKAGESYWKNQKVHRGRRISVILREERTSDNKSS